MNATMETPKVSVIIPCLNEGVWLRNTLRSLAANTLYPADRVEFIVSDDASKDGCADGLIEFWNGLYKKGAAPRLQVLKATAEGLHGPAACRNRGLACATGDLIATLDAHMVLSEGWLTKLVNVRADHGEAVTVGLSAGYRAAVTEKIENHVGLKPNEIKQTVRALQQKTGKPVIVFKSREPSDDQPGQRMRLMKKYQAPMFYLEGDAKEGAVYELHVKGCTINPDEPQPGIHYGCDLQFDPEDRGFITPKWVDWFDGKPPGRKVIPVQGLMGACYLFSREFLVDSIGGWPWLDGWIHEEPYLSICAHLLGVPILLCTEVIAAHNYDRYPKGPQNTQNKILNQIATVNICFDEMLTDVEIRLFEAPVSFAVKAKLQPELTRRRELVQKRRVMRDREFFDRIGLRHHFEKSRADKVVQRLGHVGMESSQASHEQIRTFMDGLSKNKNVRWMYSAMAIHAGGELLKFLHGHEWRVWDEARGERSPDQVDPQVRGECLGLSLYGILGPHIADWMINTTVVGRLPEIMTAIEQQSVGIFQLGTIMKQMAETVNKHTDLFNEWTKDESEQDEGADRQGLIPKIILPPGVQMPQAEQPPRPEEQSAESKPEDAKS